MFQLSGLSRRGGQRIHALTFGGRPPFLCGSAAFELLVLPGAHRTVLGAAVRACEKTGAAQAELVTKGKVHAADRDALLAHIRPVTTLAPATLVIEAIIENLSAKQDILRKVEEVGAEAILEANTSSLSTWSLQSV